MTSRRRLTPTPGTPVGGQSDHHLNPPEEFNPQVLASTDPNEAPPPQAVDIPAVEPVTVEEPPVELSPEEEIMFASLLTCGRRSKTLHIFDHTVVVQTLCGDDDLRVGLYCLAGETPVITKSGVKKIEDLAGGPHTVLTAGGNWVEAPFKDFGEQKLMRVVVRRSGIEREFFATPEHRWFYQKVYEQRKEGRRWRGWEKKEAATTELSPGMRLVPCYARSWTRTTIFPSPFGKAHGFVVGDGHLMGRNKGCAADFHGEKDAAMTKYFAECRFGEYVQSDGATPRATGMPNFFKTPPSLDESSTYLYGYLAGYFAADGTVSKDGRSATLTSTNKRNIEHAQAVCQILGIRTLDIGEYTSSGYHEPQVYYLGLDVDSLSDDFFCIEEHRRRWLARPERKRDRYSWTVVSVEETDRTETVYCAVVPNTESFALAGNILTGNCKDYQGSLGEQRAYQIGVAAAGIRTIDGKPLVQSLFELADDDALFDQKVSKVAKMYPTVISQIYRTVMDAEKEFVELATKLGKLRG